jgi:hypothetical protein
MPTDQAWMTWPRDASIGGPGAQNKLIAAATATAKVTPA